MGKSPHNKFKIFLKQEERHMVTLTFNKSIIMNGKSPNN